MHYHPYIKHVDLDSIGVWEAGGKIVGVVHPEHSQGTAYFQVDPGHTALKRDMLEYAEEHVSAQGGGARRVAVYINDRDDDLQCLAADRGYVESDRREPMTSFPIRGALPPVSVPAGFRLQTLAEENDLKQVHRVLWRGFGHGDTPPEEGIEERRFMQSAPDFRKDLNIVVKAPDGNFVSYCGMWYEPVHSVAYVEPVATDPDYRGMGLGRAAVLEGIRRCGELGAEVAYVGSALPFYLSIGFRQVYNRTAWRREWV
jgi:predicted N-acetyltransferase YhbS